MFEKKEKRFKVKSEEGFGMGAIQMMVISSFYVVQVMQKRISNCITHKHVGEWLCATN